MRLGHHQVFYPPAIHSLSIRNDIAVLSWQPRTFIAILGVVAVLASGQAAENLVQSAIHPTKAWLGA